MTVSVIIVSYNVKFFLEQCLHSVLAATGRTKLEVIVVDNRSNDGTIEYLAPLFPGVNFMDAGDNIGFGRASNLGLSKATGEYILFLNPDTLVPEDCFEKCLRFLENRLQAGAVGVRMLDGNGRFLPESKRSFPSASAAFYKLSGLAGIFPRSRTLNKYSLSHLDELGDHKVDVLAGAFMMVRKQVLTLTGGFDEQFFMYGEDIDLSYRIVEAGYENWYISNTSIIHFKGESTKKDKRAHAKMFYEAMTVFVKKHYRQSGFLLRGLLKAGILMRGALSTINTFFAGRKKALPSESNTLVVGTAAEYEECLQIIRESGASIQKPGRVKVHEDDSHDAIGNLHQLKSLARHANAVVFCQGFLQYSNIIDIIQHLDGDLSFRFHASGSNSIVGSDSKFTTGEAIGGSIVKANTGV